MSKSGNGIPLIWKITIGFALGIVAGATLGPKVAMVEPVGTVFITLLKMLIVPLVFSSLVVGVSSIGDPKALGRIGVKTILLYLVTTALAIVIGLGMGHFFKPGAGMAIAGFEAAAGKTAPGLAEVIVGMFPSNPVQALAQGHMLQIIVFALFFGIAAMLAGDKGKPVISFMDSMAETMYKVTDLVMSLAPYGVFALIAVTVSKYGISVLAPFAKVIGAVYLGCIVHAVVVYSGMVSVMAGKSPLWFFRGIQEASITAFVTRSSSATLPVTMTCCQEKMGISEKISSFVLPLGATINMDGTALYQGVCALFIAQAFGIDLSVGAQVGIIVTATLASIGTAGVPGAGLIMLTLVVTQAGLPMEGVAMVAGIDAVLDMARTSLNVTGDACVAAVMAKSEGEQF